MATSAQRYRIRVRGHLGPAWSDWFDGFRVSAEPDGDTTLEGPVADQAALHGLLARVRDLGLTLLAVEAGNAAQPGDDEPVPGHTPEGRAAGAVDLKRPRHHLPATDRSRPLEEVP